MRQFMILLLLLGFLGLGGCKAPPTKGEKLLSARKKKISESFVRPTKKGIFIDKKLLSQHNLGVLWTLPIRGDSIEKMYLLGDSLYIFAPKEKFLYRIDRRVGKIIWAFRLKEGLSFRPALWEYSKEEQRLTGIKRSDELVVISKNEVYIIDKEFGIELGSIRLDEIAPSAPPGVHRYNVYLCGEDGRIYSFSKKNYVENWRYLTDGNIVAAPLGAPERGKMDLIYVPSSDGRLYGLKATTGHQGWNRPLRTYGRIIAPPIYHKEKIYVGSTDSSLYCVNAATGTKIWSYICEAPITTAPVAITTKVYAISKNRFLYALHYSTGRFLWKYPSSKDTVTLTSGKMLTGRILSDSELTDTMDIRIHGKTQVVDRGSIKKIVWGAHRVNRKESPKMVLARGREVLFVLNNKREIVGLEDKTGLLQWKLKAGSVDFFVTNPSPYNRDGTLEERIDAGVIILGFKKGWIVALREKDGF